MAVAATERWLTDLGRPARERGRRISTRSPDWQGTAHDITLVEIADRTSPVQWTPSPLSLPGIEAYRLAQRACPRPPNPEANSHGSVASAASVVRLRPASGGGRRQRTADPGGRNVRASRPSRPVPVVPKPSQIRPAGAFSRPPRLPHRPGVRATGSHDRGTDGVGRPPAQEPRSFPNPGFCSRSRCACCRRCTRTTTTTAPVPSNWLSCPSPYPGLSGIGGDGEPVLRRGYPRRVAYRMVHPRTTRSASVSRWRLSGNVPARRARRHPVPLRADSRGHRYGFGARRGRWGDYALAPRRARAYRGAAHAVAVTPGTACRGRS
jgi:hypothetical protein